MYVGAGEGLGQTSLPKVPGGLQLILIVDKALRDFTRTPEGYKIFFLRLTFHPFPYAEDKFSDFFVMSDLSNHFTKPQILGVLEQIRDNLCRRDHDFKRMVADQRRLQSEMLSAAKKLSLPKIKPFLLKLATTPLVLVGNGEQIVTGVGRAFAQKFAKQMLPAKLSERLTRSIANPSHFARLLVYLESLAEAYRLRRIRK